MDTFCKTLKSKPDFFSFTCTSVDQIREAENTLNLHFAPEYREYLSTYGVASADGHEFTGICASPRLNVINVTQEEKAETPNIPADWYVVEQAHIDGIVIWQSATGEIYQTRPGARPICLCSSLADYINL